MSDQNWMIPIYELISDSLRMVIYDLLSIEFTGRVKFKNRVEFRVRVKFRSKVEFRG